MRVTRFLVAGAMTMALAGAVAQGQAQGPSAVATGYQLPPKAIVLSVMVW